MFFIGEGDIRINTPHRTFSALTTEMQEVTFTLLPDAVAQESSETLTLRLNFDETLFDESIDTLITELHVTIIDCESKLISISELIVVSTTCSDKSETFSK